MFDTFVLMGFEKCGVKTSCAIDLAMGLEELMFLASQLTNVDKKFSSFLRGGDLEKGWVWGLGHRETN